MAIESLGHSRRTTVPPVLGYGFRPFFLMAGLSAVMMLAVWLAVLGGGGWPAGTVTPAAWHAHEMLFGFVGATIGGFMLTAIPNWTGARPVTGWPLGGLVALWLAGRVASSPLLAPSALGAAVDLAFFPVLGAAVAIPLLRAGRIRNTAFLALLALLTAANLLIQLEWLGITWTADTGIALATGVVLMMIAVVGGRIVPAFTRNALQVAIAPHPWADRAALLSTLAIIPVDIALPGGTAAGAVALVAAVAHAVRLSHWQGLRTLRLPILWILHAGYGWIVVALALKAAALLGGFVQASAWLHALTIGVFSTMILAVMTRAALGHTGRPLVAARPTVAAYAMLLAAGLLRVAAPALPGAHYHHVVGLAGLLWVGAFLLFLWVYTPILTRTRPDGRPG